MIEQPPTDAPTVPADSSPPLSLAALGWLFLRLGATAFGGLGAALALIERDLVEQRRALTRADVTEALTYTKLLPGSTVVQVVAYLGYRLGGWLGSALATAAFILPSMALMLVLAVGYSLVAALPALGPAINGLSAAVVGLLLATLYRLGKANIKDWRGFALALAAFAAGAVFGVNAAFIVIAAGLIGLLLFANAADKKGEA